jgi:hypothetical protein
VVKIGDADLATVRAIQHRLNEVGCGPLTENGVFDPSTKSAVELFQARFPDAEGSPLTIDGKVGPLTWAALFGAQAVSVVSEVADPLLARVLEVARSQIGVMEQPPGSNHGPEVDNYLRAVGLNPTGGGFAWCVAFVYWCFKQAADALQQPNPMIKTAGVLDHWRKAGQQGIRRILADQATDNPVFVKPGQIFVISTGGGQGHTGLVELVKGGKLTTIEGNTNNGGSREGVGVFRRDSRKITQINEGFIDYSRG